MQCTEVKFLASTRDAHKLLLDRLKYNHGKYQVTSLDDRPTMVA